MRPGGLCGVSLAALVLSSWRGAGSLSMQFCLPCSRERDSSEPEWAGGTRHRRHRGIAPFPRLFSSATTNQIPRSALPADTGPPIIPIVDRPKVRTALSDFWPRDG